MFESIPLHLPHDIVASPFQNMLWAIEVLSLKNGRCSVPELPKIRDAFERVITTDRNKLPQTFYASQQSNKS